MTSAPYLAFDPRRPFAREWALRAGLTPRRLRSRQFRRLFTGIYVAADVPMSPLLWAEAALIPYAGRAARASHATAARVWDLPIPVSPGEHVTVSCRDDRRPRAGVTCHVGTANAGAAVTVDGVAVSDVPQTFVELAASLSLVDLVVVGDAMVRRGMVTLARLRQHCASATGTGAAQARLAAAFVRERVDSPMESRLRMLIVLAGLPEPQVNLLVGDPAGGYRKYDLSWPEVRLIVEYDGRHHVERVEQWESDLARREGIDDDRWRIVVVVASGIFARPDRTLEKIHRLLVERAHPAVSPRLRDDWRAHVPVRA